jgi:hypothetical protein
MTTSLEKFKHQEIIRRSFFKNRGNVLAIIEETGLDGDYVRSTCDKIKGSFRKDVNFEIACFITDAILAGREQRLIILEDLLKELLGKKEYRSKCCGRTITTHEYENKTWYKCDSCKADCDVVEVDKTNYAQINSIIDKMRKEDELVAKFLTAMGIIAKTPTPESKDVTTNPQTRISVESNDVTLPPVEQKLLDKLNSLPESKISEIRRTLENIVNEALYGTSR